MSAVQHCMRTLYHLLASVNESAAASRAAATLAAAPMPSGQLDWLRWQCMQEACTQVVKGNCRERREGPAVGEARPKGHFAATVGWLLHTGEHVKGRETG